ncbi:MAG TPA: DUF456 domain-containing protein [Oceanobacillus sp.]|nr:DUF456 domain-containing protein [Oceanobacillus sp.]
MEFLESSLILFTCGLMGIALIISILPFVPGPAILWGISLAFGILDNFNRLPVLAFLFMTFLMIAGSTTDFWMPLLGMKARGATLGSTLATIVGALAGTFFIPVPVLGTLAGAMTGALAVEFLYVGNARRSMRAAGLALESYILSIFVEFIINVCIVGVFIFSLLVTRPGV